MRKLIAYALAAYIVLPVVGEIIVGSGIIPVVAAAEAAQWKQVKGPLWVDADSENLKSLQPKEQNFAVLGDFGYAQLQQGFDAPFSAAIDLNACLGAGEGDIWITPSTKVSQDHWTLSGHRAIDYIGQELCAYAKKATEDWGDDPNGPGAGYPLPRHTSLGD